MKTVRYWVVSLTLLAAACGGSEQADRAETGSQLAESTQQASASGELSPLFDGQLQRPRCPARASRLTGPDVIGVRIGMTRDEALAAVFCPRDEFNVLASTQWLNVQTHGGQLGVQTIKLQDGRPRRCTEVDQVMGGQYDRIFGIGCAGGSPYVLPQATQEITLATPGIPGQERVAAIWRYERFEEKPTVDNTLASFTTKFGPASNRQETDEGTQLAWVWTPQNTPMPANSPLLSSCVSAVHPARAGNVSSVDGCGLTIVAAAYRDDENPVLARSYAVAMVSPVAIQQTHDAMQDHFAQAQQASQQAEIERAQKASAPDL